MSFAGLVLGNADIEFFQRPFVVFLGHSLHRVVENQLALRQNPD